MFTWEKVKDFEDTYLEYEKEGKVARVVLNKPEFLNAVGFGSVMHFTDAFQIADEDENIEVIIMKGNGRAFGSGAYMGPGGLGEQYGRNPTLRHRLYLDRHTPDHEKVEFYSKKATIAQVHGYAVGAHFRITFYADMVIAAQGTGFH